MTGRSNANFFYDFLIIGSGFGGSVAAMRLAQKGYSVCVLEMGRDLQDSDFPKSNWNLRKFLWAPLLRCFGPQKITFLKRLTLLHGVGVGGGSLVYAATLLKPAREVFEKKDWPDSHSWNKELDPYFETAKRMLGVERNPKLYPADRLLEEVTREVLPSATVHETDVGIHFNSNGEKTDPYFSGDGPVRTPCVFCGGCMVGCRYGSKNTLDKNYLHFARKWGAVIVPETKAEQIIPLEDGAGYEVTTTRSTSWLPTRSRSFRSRRVILSAGVLGTNEILLKNRDLYRTLPRISSRLGETVRTNGESLVGATSLDPSIDLSQGIAIGSGVQADANTKIEAVRYPAGSGALRLMAVPLTGQGTWVTRPLKLLVGVIRRFKSVLRLWLLKDWGRHTVIFLLMRSDETKMKLQYRLGLRGEFTGGAPESYFPLAQEFARRGAEKIRGVPQNAASEVLLGAISTAHILGGACLGRTAGDGVVDTNHEIFGHKGLYVCDGSVIPSNLGVNPSLTITALAERFASQFPARDATNVQEREIRFT